MYARFPAPFSPASVLRAADGPKFGSRYGRAFQRARRRRAPGAHPRLDRYGPASPARPQAVADRLTFPPTPCRAGLR